MKKRDNLLIKIINICVFLITNLAVIYVLYFNTNEEYKLIFILPIIFEICYFLSLRQFILKFKEFGTVFLFVAFARYVLLPILITFNGGYEGRSLVEPELKSFNLAFLLMSYELIISSVVIYFLTKKIKNVFDDNKKINAPKSLFIYSVFAVFILILLMLEPSIIKSLSFVFPNKNVFNYDDFNLVQQMTIMGLMIVKQLIFVIGVYKCKEKYDKTNNKIFILISVVLLIMNSIIYFGSNRSDFLLMLGASIIYWIVIFKKYNRTIIGIAIVLGIIVFLAITQIRKYQSVSKNTNKIMDITDTIQIYSGGPYNVAIAIETSEMFSEERNLKTLVFDFMRPTLGINLIARKMNLKYSNMFFNYRLFYGARRTHIIPMIGEGFFCLGFILSPAINIIFICIAFKLKKTIKKTKRIEKLYFFTITMLRLGFMMGQNASIQMNDLSFNLFVPMILLWLNDQILLKRKNHEENK